MIISQEGNENIYIKMKLFIHIDMDCYYAQAECKRLSLDPSKPICAR